MDTNTFLQTHRVFSLDEATQAMTPKGGRKAVVARLKYAATRNRVKNLARGVYASVPAGVAPEAFQPDHFLIAQALRPDAIFSHHSALELLGAAHSVWGLCTAYSAGRARAIDLDGVVLRFLAHPCRLERRHSMKIGTRTIHYLDRDLSLTGPERTLIDGFRHPDLAGGIPELVESAAGFPVLELPLLFDLLESYAQKKLWAAIGWFLESYRKTFFVSDTDLAQIGKQIPKSPLYLTRDHRGGIFVRRWNLIVPDALVSIAEPNEV